MNWEYFTKDLSWDSLASVLIGTLLLYGALILYTRFFGLKSFSKMTGFDFITTIAIGNLFAMSIGTGNPKLVVGGVLIGLLYFMNYLISLLQFKSNAAQSVLDNSPILLMRNGAFLEENLKRCKVTKDELRGKLREANVIRLEQAKAVILETTGDVSVLHTDQEMDVESFLLEDVIT
ncbi:YetF domain-containing protein [Altibacter sp.]|uniref:DUF421 domain-containing protein n=1 Tax=Altibacter sp. TaxID=2024823 RepID=UPI000C899292|nr:YetF domain-containing protein [Altibacter sp.]MAP55714.1 hypothetical protein [Altibacter sp.]|tara:strand:- start:500 stop:1030 length:531 start_codon:yes stop_codon:yes gene_type:complete